MAGVFGGGRQAGGPHYAGSITRVYSFKRRARQLGGASLLALFPEAGRSMSGRNGSMISTYGPSTNASRNFAHASESGEARFGGLSGTLALEQFPRLFPGRGRSSASQRVGCAEDEDPTSGRVTRSRTVSAVREATARKAREVAHLPVCFG